MPMIDIYAATGTFPDTHKLAVEAAAIVREVEQVPDVPMFRRAIRDQRSGALLFIGAIYDPAS